MKQWGHAYTNHVLSCDTTARNRDGSEPRSPSTSRCANGVEEASRREVGDFLSVLVHRDYHDRGSLTDSALQVIKMLLYFERTHKM